jgi:hypothetical protein
LSLGSRRFPSPLHMELAEMASDSKPSPVAGTPAPKREKGVIIFTYPKIIFIFPTLIMSLICWIGMMTIRDVPEYNYNRKMAKHKPAASAKADPSAPKIEGPTTDDLSAKDNRIASAFKRKENILGMLFLTVLFLNLMILAIDFPRFAIFALILGGTTLMFFLLWLGFFVNIFEPIVRMLEGVYVVANAEFYLLFALVLTVIYGLVWITRWLDYWEILPNEILHHHGPLSDLERYPTLNLKFDKEIPDVFEYFMFGAGRLVLHVSEERKALVMDNVLWVSKKEEGLKKLMSRLEVRVTTDQEVASP